MHDNTSAIVNCLCEELNGCEAKSKQTLRFLALLGTSSAILYLLIMGSFSSNNRVKIQGRIVEGLREAGNFTQIPWVRNQFISKLSIDPYPGTLNLEIVDPESLQNFKELKTRKGKEITSEDPSFCSAKCYPVLISGRLKGAIVLPMVENYPKNKMELIASQKINETLSLTTGDILEVEIL
jgi:riboflavin kinase